MIADKLCLNDGTDVGKVCPQVVHCINVGAGGAGGAHLAEVLLGFANGSLASWLYMVCLHSSARNLESGTR